MDRKDFLSALGLSAASLTILNCMSCSKSGNGSNSSTNAPTGIDFTLDLSSSSNAALTKTGGYLAANGVLVAHTLAGAYIAVQQSCTHQNYPLVYEGSGQQFYCANHGATFNEKGVVTGGPTSKSLATYNTKLTGTSLRIYS